MVRKKTFTPITTTITTKVEHKTRIYIFIMTTVIKAQRVCEYCNIGLGDEEYFTVYDQETMCEDCMELH